eukprot:s1433_g13.t1
MLLGWAWCLAGRAAGWLAATVAGWLAAMLAGCSSTNVGWAWFFGRPAGWVAGWLAGWLLCWLLLLYECRWAWFFGRPAGWLAGCAWFLASRPAGRLGGPAGRPAGCFAGWLLLYECSTNYAELVAVCGVPLLAEIAHEASEAGIDILALSTQLSQCVLQGASHLQSESVAAEELRSLMAEAQVQQPPVQKPTVKEEGTGKDDSGHKQRRSLGSRRDIILSAVFAAKDNKQPLNNPFIFSLTVLTCKTPRAMNPMDGAATARAVLVDGMGGMGSCGVARVRPWSREFCGVAFPRDLLEVKDRMLHNSVYFFANYVVLLQAAILLGLLSNIWALLLGTAFSGATYALLFTDCGSSTGCDGALRYACAVPLVFLTTGFVLSFAHELIYAGGIWLMVVLLHISGKPLDAKGSYIDI